MEQNENTLSVLKIAPGQYPQQVEIDNDLKALQQAVGGSIGASYPFEDPVAIVYNDDGKLMGLPLNRALWDEDPLLAGRRRKRKNFCPYPYQPAAACGRRTLQGRQCAVWL